MKALNQTTPFQDLPVKNEFDYIEEMFLAPNDVDMRYLTLYNEIDTKRKDQWRKIPKAELERSNIQYIKFLVAKNLSEKVKKAKEAQQEPIFVNNEENKPAQAE